VLSARNFDKWQFIVAKNNHRWRPESVSSCWNDCI